MKQNLLFIFLVLWFFNSNAEEQVIRGKIISATTGKPVAGALISIFSTENTFTVSNEDGSYMKSVIPGTYSITVSAAGYKSQVRNNVIVLSGKQQVLDFELNEFNILLDSVQIISNTIRENISLDLWNIQRFAAVFYDPARVVNSHAAIINGDDQANNLCIHGTSPNYTQWRVEGVEVVNPNHLENAGTINDKPSLNGGGVSLFSAQLLQNSGFQLSPFDPSGGNSLTGIFDMRLRNGNNEKFERIIQASLLGLDISVEGPLSKKTGPSFLFNYRYSTIGLLSKMGIDFGGEKTNFQDLSFIFSFPLKNGQLRLFSMTGKSETIFRGPTDSAKIETQKDLQDIDYHSATTINGINFLHSFSNTFFVRSILAYSGKTVDRFSRASETAWLIVPQEKDFYKTEKISGTTYVSKRISNQLRIKAGSYYNYFTNEEISSVNDVTYSKGIISDPIIEPFISFDGTVFNKLEFKAGVHAFYMARLNDVSVQPRILTQYNISKRQDLSFSYGKTSQLQPFYLSTATSANFDLKPTICDAFTFVHHIKIFTLDIRNEFYYQLFSKIPINTEHEFSAFNYFNEQETFPLFQEGKAKVYGVDVTVEKNMNSYYVILSSSFYQNEYTLGDKTYSGRFNTRYNLALTAGKEYYITTKKIFGTDLRAFYRNGFKEQDHNLPPDLYYYNSQLPSYYRIDLRISYRKNNEKTSVIWAIDIQNLTNTKNISYHAYDVVTRRYEPHYQLGIIPVLSYKIFF